MTPRQAPRGGHIRYRSSTRRRRVLITRLRFVLCLCLAGILLVACENTLLSAIPLPLTSWILSLVGVHDGGLLRAAPALGLLFAMAVGFLLGEEEGSLAGLLTGLLCEAATASVGVVETAILLPILFALCGGLSGLLCKRGLGQNWPSFLVFAAVGGALTVGFELIRAALSAGGFPPLSYALLYTVPRWITTTLASPLVYGVVRLATYTRRGHRVEM